MKLRNVGASRRTLVLFVVAFAFCLIGAGPAAAAIQVSISSPADGAQALQGVVPVDVAASADDGIYSVWLFVDGQPWGIATSLPVSQYQYVIPWDTSGLPQGDHTLTVLATDWSLGLLTQMSDPVHVDVGPAYPTVHLTAPPSWTFVRGSMPITVTSTSAVAPASVAYTVDGAPVSTPWNTTSVADGVHTLAATITDGRNKTGSDSESVVVDNTGPTTSLTAPASNTYLSGSLVAKATASDAFGVQSVQFAIDGAPVGVPIAQPDAPGGYSYSATLDVSTLASGAHNLTSVATDAAGNTTTSAPVTFTIGTAPPVATVTAPLDWSYASKVVTVTAAVTGAAGPFSAQLVVDGAAVGVPDTTAPYTFKWDTAKVVSGNHTVAVSVTDSLKRTSTSAVVHELVDNAPPTAFILQPSANARIAGPTTLQVDASDAYGIKAAQLTIDGIPVGAVLTAPDAGQQYVYTITYDTSHLAAGSHVVSAIVTDNAGNIATVAPVTIKTGPIQYLPVLNYHSISTTGSIYHQTLAEADQQLAYLKANGYQAISLAQYQQWVAGANIGVAKPVLLTVDDGLNDQLAWDALFQKYGMKGVLFVITGFADNTTPGDGTANNMNWTTIRQLAANGRWQIAFHAGEYGHGDYYASGSAIALNATQSLTLPAACEYFYSCLGTITTTTTTGSGRNQKITTTTAPETFATFKTLVTNEVTAGLAELKQKVPTASMLAWAAPFNDAGQWTNLFNDPTGQAQAWMAGFFASKLPLVFTQTNPVDYGQAPGTVGSLTGFNRHYRFEVHTDTTLDQFAAALQDPAFGR